MSQVYIPKRTLRAIVRFNVKLRTVTGLLIRMPVHAQAFKIGGADQYPMVTRKRYCVASRETELEVPYIPGSSIKGRMRSLLELALGKELYTTDFKIWQHTRSISIKVGEAKREDVKKKAEIFASDVRCRCLICELFGWPAANYQQIRNMFLEAIKEEVGEAKFKELGEKFETEAENRAKEIFDLLAPTRLIVSDFFPDEKYIEERNIKSIADFLEEKSENRIDRVTSAADPRNIVRVKPEVVFSGTITLLLFDHDKDQVEHYLRTIALGLKLIEETYLGGCGSRGYGRVKFGPIDVFAEKVSLKSSGSNSYPLLEKIELEQQHFVDLDSLIEVIPKIAEAIIRSTYSQ